MGGVIWGVPTFVRQLVVQAPVEQVFAFHEREDALPRLSPPFPPMRVVSRTGGIRTGARVELRIGPVRWLALHTDYRVNALFGQLVAWSLIPMFRFRHRVTAHACEGGAS